MCPIDEKMLVVQNQLNTTWIENSTCRSCKKSKLPAAGINEKQCQYLPKYVQIIGQNNKNVGN